MKKAVSLILAMFLMMSLSIFDVSAEEVGISVNVSDLYKTKKVYDTLPNTFEATVFFPENMNASTRGGVILGNYTGSGRCINFEIHTSGTPRLYWVDEDGTVHDWQFRNANVYNGQWNHIAIVREADGSYVTCYVNGEAVQLVNQGNVSQSLCTLPFAVGGDLRSGNAQYFKGLIKNIAVYADSRTEAQILDDYQAQTISTDNLIAGYDFSSISGELPDRVEDISGNGYDIGYEKIWFEEKEPVKDYAYSFAVVGDTQIVAEKYTDYMTDIYQWIVDNAEKKNIKFVMGLGDITNSNTSREWSACKEAIQLMDGVIPYSLNRGNHDGAAQFNSAFMGEYYHKQLEEAYNDKLENTWQELVVGDIKYLIMTLDYGAGDDILQWASGVIEAHPYHNVIITTHAYLFRDGTTLDQGDVCPPATTGGSNNGDHIWEKLASKHENIVLVLSGHDPCDNIIMAQTKGDNGNVVTQMLIDPQGVDAAQGATGLVAMLYFSEDGKNVQVEYYSTVRQQYFMSSNQFEMELNVVETPAPTATPTPVPPTATPPAAQSPTPTPSNAQTTPTEGEGLDGAVIGVIIFGIIVIPLAVIAFVIYGTRKKK